MSKHKKKNRNKNRNVNLENTSNLSFEDINEAADEAQDSAEEKAAEETAEESKASEAATEAAAAEEAAGVNEVSEAEDSTQAAEAEDGTGTEDTEETAEASDTAETAEASDTAETAEAEEAAADAASEEGEAAQIEEVKTAEAEETTDDGEDSDEAEEEDSEETGEKKSSGDDKNGKDKSDAAKSRVSRNALREQSENERLRREARHKRRVRQQATAYAILVILIAVIGLGLYFGIRFFVNSAKERREAEIAQELALQQQLEQEAAQQAEQEIIENLPTVEDLGATPMEQLDAVIAAEIANMTLEEKVQGLMFITPESITGVDRVVIAGDGTAAALSDFCPGGIVYSSKNVNSADQFATMVTNTMGMVGRPVFFATTETGLNESGLITAGVIETVPNPTQSAEAGDVEQVVGTGMAIGTGLGTVGINVNFAPTADLAVTAGGIGEDASYGADASSITPYVTAMADGLNQSGIIPAYKYFPSLAACSQNPLYGRAVSDRTLEDFRSNEFQIWLSAINAGAMMIQMSNVIYPEIDSDSLPSSLSEKTVTGVLRDELKYDGVIISGPLSDAAITEYYTVSESAVMALKAGCDMIYSSPDPKAAVAGIMEAVANGVVSEDRIDDALVRIYRIRYADMLAQFRAEYEANAVSMGVDLTGVAY